MEQTRVRESGFSNVSNDELLQLVQNKTYRQVRDLKIDYRGSVIAVTGRSRTYYTKQLATQAIRDAVPHASIDNHINVLAG